jgi:hypothetical protein
MKNFLLSVGLAVLATAAQADTNLPQSHVNSMACLENMGQSTSWGQCLSLIFEPCASFEVASTAHVACLQSEREGWTASMRLLQEDVTEADHNKICRRFSEYFEWLDQLCLAEMPGRWGS